MANQTALVVFAAVLAVVCGILVVPRVIMLTGYTSKIACSAVFVHGRSVDSVMAGELHTFPLSLASITVHSNSSVTSTFGVIGRTSQFVEGFGCVLVHYNGPDRVAARLAPSPPQPSSTVPGPWPFGSDDGTTGDISSELKQHLDGAFSEPDPTCLRTTRAVVVAHKGKLVYEGYADGFNAKMRYAGWSMTKSVMSAIVGLRVAEGAMRLQDEVSPTSASLESLLHMTSGLRFAEVRVCVVMCVHCQVASVHMPIVMVGFHGACWFVPWAGVFRCESLGRGDHVVSTARRSCVRCISAADPRAGRGVLVFIRHHKYHFTGIAIILLV